MDLEAELYPGAFRSFSNKTDIGSLHEVWGKFMNGLKKEIDFGGLEPRRELDVQAALLSAFKTESDMGHSISQDIDLLRMYDLHDGKIVLNRDDQINLENAIQETLENRDIPNTGNVTPINPGILKITHDNIPTESLVSLLGYNIKPRVLFNLIVWGGEHKPGRYRFLPNVSDEYGVENGMLQPPYQYTEDEIKRLTEIYTSPHFRLNPNHFHWDEIMVPIIRDRSNLKTKRIVLKVWKDLEWIEENRWNRDLWSHEGGHDHIMTLRKKILERHILDSVIEHQERRAGFIIAGDESRETFIHSMGFSGDPFLKAILEASLESESLDVFFRDTLNNSLLFSLDGRPVPTF